MCLLGSLAGVGAYYLDQESAHRNLWLIGSGLFFTVWPYTLIVMMSDIKKNLQSDAISKLGKFSKLYDASDGYHSNRVIEFDPRKQCKSQNAQR